MIAGDALILHISIHSSDWNLKKIKKSINHMCVGESGCWPKRRKSKVEWRISRTKIKMLYLETKKIREKETEKIKYRACHALIAFNVTDK